MGSVIAKSVKGPDLAVGVSSVEALRQDDEKLLAREDATAKEWWNLTQKLNAREVTALAKDAAAQTVMLDRHHEPARRLLGMVRYNGVWMRPNEIATARGEVFFRGAWVTWEVQQLTLADETKRREEQAAARKERDEQRRQARLAAAEAAAARTPVIYPETYVSGYYRSPYYNPYGGWRYPIYGSGHSHPPICFPTKPYPQPCPPSGGLSWHVGAVGGGSHHAWSLNWSGGSSIGSSFP
jgi:hypothetical protein